MELLVCLKWVALRPEVDPLTGAVSVDHRFSGAGPADRSALEWALRLARPIGATVTALSVGGPEADTLLREALAVGADGAERIDGPTGADSRSVAAAIADRGRPAELVVCGDRSLDRGSGSVPAFVAHELGWPQALGVVAAAPTDEGWLVERRLDQGRRERLRLHGPGVVSFEAGPELRRASLSGTLAAGTTTVDVRPWPAPRCHPPVPEVVTTGPYRPRAMVVPAPTGSARERVVELLSRPGGVIGTERHQMSSRSAARLVVDRLVAWGYLDVGPAADDDPDAADRNPPASVTGPSDAVPAGARSVGIDHSPGADGGPGGHPRDREQAARVRSLRPGTGPTAPPAGAEP